MRDIAEFILIISIATTYVLALENYIDKEIDKATFFILTCIALSMIVF